MGISGRSYGTRSYCRKMRHNNSFQRGSIKRMSRMNLMFCAIASIGFFVVGLAIRPPAQSDLSRSNAYITELQPIGSRDSVTFRTEDGLRLQCIRQGRVQWKCPAKELQRAFNDSLVVVLWHNHDEIYQIQSEGKFLLSLDRWYLESNIVFCLSAFWCGIFCYLVIRYRALRLTAEPVS